MSSDPLLQIIQTLETVLQDLRVYAGEELVSTIEEFSIESDRLLPTQEEVDKMENEDVDAMLKSYAIDGGEVCGTARIKRQALKAIIAEMEGDDLEQKWTSSMLKTVGGMLGVKPTEDVVLKAIQSRSDTISNDVSIEDTEEATEEPESADSADFAEGDSVIVTVDDADYDGVVLDANVDADGERVIQVQITDEDGEEDVIDLPPAFVKKTKENVKAPEEPVKDSEETEEVDFSSLFSKEKISEVADRVSEFTNAQIADGIEAYIDMLKVAKEEAESDDGEEETVEWISTMLSLMESETEDLEVKALFYVAAFLPDDSKNFVGEDTPCIIDGKIFCNGVPMGVLEDISDLVIAEDSTSLNAGDVLGNTEDFIPCMCFVCTKAWAYDMDNEEFVEFAFSE